MSNNLIFNHSIRKVATQKEADLLTKLLAENKIISKIEKESFNPSSTFSEGSLSSNFDILINAQDKFKANELILQEASKHLNEIDPSYYLFSFSSEELMDVLQNEYKWSDIDILLSEKLLLERGVTINKAAIELNNTKEIAQLSKPKKKPKSWIVLGYLFSIFGGIGGIMTAYSVMKEKSKLPDGSIVYDYDSSTRNHAENMAYISIIGIFLWLVILFLRIN